MFLNENLNRYNSRLKTRAESFDNFCLLIVFFYKNLDWMTLVSAVTLTLGGFYLLTCLSLGIHWYHAGMREH